MILIHGIFDIALSHHCFMAFLLYQDFTNFNYMQNNFIKAMQKQKYLDSNGAANINNNHDELEDNNSQPNHSCVEVEVI